MDYLHTLKRSLSRGSSISSLIRTFMKMRTFIRIPLYLTYSAVTCTRKHGREGMENDSTRIARGILTCIKDWTYLSTQNHSKWAITDNYLLSATDLNRMRSEFIRGGWRRSCVFPATTDSAAESAEI